MQYSEIKFSKFCPTADERNQVFGPSTDYRDPRKAAYQEYLVTNDFNVARIPGNLSAHKTAAIGVAFVSAVLSLGVSLGVNFANIVKGPPGPNLQEILRISGRNQVPEDVQAECFDSITNAESPKHGDWIAIWGGQFC